MNNREISNIASALKDNLHGSAGENIISTLLSATINESDLLKRFIMEEVRKRKSGESKNKRGRPFKPQNIYAMTNSSYPKRFGIESDYRPDIMLYDKKLETSWDYFYKQGKYCTENRKEEAKKYFIVFLEVKLLHITKEDTEKYEHCAKQIIEYCQKIEKPCYHFGIISSHSNDLKKRIMQKSKGVTEERWQEIFKDKSIPHVTLEEIKNNIEKDNSSAIVKIFKKFLEYQFEPETKDIWKAHEEYCSDVKFTKQRKREYYQREIREAIRQIGINAGYYRNGNQGENANELVFNNETRKYTWRKNPEVVFKVSIINKTIKHRPIEFPEKGIISKDPSGTISDKLKKLKEQLES